MNASHNPDYLIGRAVDHVIREPMQYRSTIVLPHNFILKRIFRDCNERTAHDSNKFGT